jgi:chromosome segregation ATPase
MESSSPETGQSAGQESVTGLSAAIAALRTALSQATEALDTGRATVESATRVKTRSQAELGQLQKVADGLARDKQSAASAAADAAKAQHHAGFVIASLAQADKDKLFRDHAAIQAKYASEADRLKAAEKALADHQDQAQLLEQSVKQKQADFDEAFAAITRLQQAVSSEIVILKGLAKELNAAADRAEPRRAAVTEKAVSAAVNSLHASLDDAALTSLTDAYLSARQDLLAAQDSARDHAAGLATKKSDVASARAALDKAATTRKQEIAKLLAPVKDDAQAT